MPKPAGTMLAAAPEVRASRTWPGLAGHGRMALIDHRDLAEAGLRVLTDPALWGRAPRPDRTGSHVVAGGARAALGRTRRAGHLPGHGGAAIPRAPHRRRAGKNRLHLDLYPTGRDSALPMRRRIEIVEAKVAELTVLGASVESRTRHDDSTDPVYFVVMHDPEGNEFCVA